MTFEIAPGRLKLTRVGLVRSKGEKDASIRIADGLILVHERAGRGGWVGYEALSKGHPGQRFLIKNKSARM